MLTAHNKLLIVIVLGILASSTNVLCFTVLSSTYSEFSSSTQHFGVQTRKRTSSFGSSVNARKSTILYASGHIFPNNISISGGVKLCRSKLLEKIQSKQSRASRLEVEDLLENLISLQKCNFIEETALIGTWKLLWSSQTADVNPFQLPSKVLGGDCFQVLSAGRAENIVAWPAAGAALRGGAATTRAGPARFLVTIDSFTLELGPARLPLLRLTDAAPEVVVRDAPTPRAGKQVATGGDGQTRGRVLNRRTGWLEVLYADDGPGGGIRVSRADTGLLYLHQRLPA